MKLNKKGFAISTALYGLFAVLLLIVMLIFQIMRTGNNNSKEVSEQIEKEFNECAAEKRAYDNCTCTDGTDCSSDCGAEQLAYSTCLTGAR